MSDTPSGQMPPELVDIANEYRRLQRMLEARTAQLAALTDVNAEAGDFPTDFAGIHGYRRYSIDFTFTDFPETDGAVTEPQEQSVTVEHGTVFRCAYMESFLRAIGTADDPYTGDPVTVQATMPWDDRLQYFDYFFRVRDTGTDREWFDRPQPSLFGGGGYVGPLWFPRRTILGGGSTIFAQVAPFVMTKTPEGGSFFAGGEVESYNLEISFVGHEVPDTGEL